MKDDLREFSELFLRLVSVPAKSGEETGVAEFIKEYLSSLSMPFHEDNAGEIINGDANNIFVECLPEDGVLGFLTMMAHMDSVPPGYAVNPKLIDGRFSGENSILCADDREGVASLLILLKKISKNPLKNLGIQIIFTVSEESGHSGAECIPKEKFKSDFCMIFDSGGDVGNMNLSSPWAYKFNTSFVGKAAHAGVEPEKGINAIVMAGNFISSLNIGRINQETTCNIGIINGGKARNIVPDSCNVNGEVRSFNKEEAESILKKIENLSYEIAKASGGESKIEIDPLFEGFKLDEKNPFLVKLMEAYKAAGIQPIPRRTGGGSDANSLNSKGILAVNLAIGYENPHSEKEALWICEVEKLLSVQENILQIFDKFPDQQSLS